MLSKETQVIDKLAWIYIRDRKVLSTLSRGKDIWYLPGGKREAVENDAEALMREIREELNIDLVKSSITYMEAFKEQAHGMAEGVVVKMSCYRAAFEGTITASGEIEKIDYLTSADKPRSSPVDQVIIDWLVKQQLID